MIAATTVAAFDFDETLTTSDTVVPFLRRFTSVGRFAVALVPRCFRLVPVAVRRDRDRLREIATEIVFAGRSEAEVIEQAGAWGHEIFSSRLRPDTRGRLDWHLGQGHRVLIVSASYEHYVQVVAKRLGGVDVLATRLESVDGRCTGRLEGGNCRGVEKVRRLEQWLQSKGIERDEVALYAYGDSSGDRELLAYADHPHWVNEPLASVAP